MKEISSFQTGELLAVATDVSPYGTETQPRGATKSTHDVKTSWANLNE